VKEYERVEHESKCYINVLHECYRNSKRWHECVEFQEMELNGHPPNIIWVHNKCYNLTIIWKSTIPKFFYNFLTCVNTWLNLCQSLNLTSFNHMVTQKLEYDWLCMHLKFNHSPVSWEKIFSTIMWQKFGRKEERGRQEPCK